MYAGLMAMLVLGLSVALAVRLLARLVGGPAPGDSRTPYLSGFEAQQHALSRYHVRWYVASVVFLAFDVEMLFMYPWSLVVARLGWGSVIEMFVFLGALLLAVLWARREGVFRWV